MIPNLTLIIAVYVVVRLVTVALRQAPRAARHKVARIGVAVGACLAIVLVVLCVMDTIGVGLSIGSSVRHQPGMQ